MAKTSTPQEVIRSLERNIAYKREQIEKFRQRLLEATDAHAGSTFETCIRETEEEIRGMEFEIGETRRAAR